MMPTVRASGLQGYVALMESLGADPGPLLQRQRIPRAALDDAETLLPLRAVAQLYEASARATHCPDFGLRLAQVQDIGILGPLGIVLQNAATAGQALEYASRYLFVHSTGLAVSNSGASRLAPGAVEIALEIGLPAQLAQRQTVDVCLGDLHHIVQLLAGEHYQLLAVALPHTPLAPLLAYRRFFGAPVHVAQPRAALHIAATTLAAPLRDVNPVLRQITEDYLVKHFRGPGESLTARVRQALWRTLGTPAGSKADIAALLALHPRTLQRRLEAEGGSFEAIREAVRQEAALRYLRETRVPLNRLAELLGYSEQSAMSRSCRRWFGQPPSALRRQARSAARRG